MKKGISVNMDEFYILVKKGGLSIKKAAEKLAEPCDYLMTDFFYSDIRQVIEAIDINTLVKNVKRIGIERFGLGRNV